MRALLLEYCSGHSQVVECGHAREKGGPNPVRVHFFVVCSLVDFDSVNFFGQNLHNLFFGVGEESVSSLEVYLALQLLQIWLLCVH